MFKIKSCLGLLKSFNVTRGLTLCALFSTSIMVASPALAEPTKLDTSGRSMDEMRRLFVATEQQINQRRFTAARENMQKLTSYPLYPYLEVEFLKQNLSYANEGLVAEFLDEYAGTPLDWRLRTPWLNFLVQQNDAERFLTYYQGSSNAQLQCRYLDYLWKTTDNVAVLWPQVANQWVSAQSQPSLCDGVFQAWVEAGYRTEAMIWQRIELAVLANENNLARYLTRLLPEDKRYLGELYRRVQANPAVIMQFESFPGNDDREQDIVLSGLHRFIWRDVDRAQEAWLHYQDFYAFSDAARHDVQERFGITLAVRGRSEALDWLLEVPPSALSDTGRHWVLASLVKAQRWDKVVMLYNGLPPVEQEKGQWLYWRARSLEMLRFYEESEAIFQQVAATRSYYGFLAAARLQQPPELEYAPVVYEPESKRRLREEPSVQRALELLALDRLLDARREWNVVAMRGTYDQQVMSAVLAHDEGWFDQAIFGLARTGHFNDVKRRFPLAYRDLLESNAREQKLDPAWVYAIARRESAFRADAVSSAGARGLLQVMPGTAQYISRRTPGPNLGRISNHRLLQPEDNVRLGTRYMADLMRRTDQNWIIATAAYNAGMNRVVEWLPETPMDFDIWVENVPFQETRDYVKNVLAYQQIYSILLGYDTQVLMPLITLQMYANGTS